VKPKDEATEGYLDRLGRLFPALASPDSPRNTTGAILDASGDQVVDDASPTTGARPQPEALYVRIRRFSADHVKVLSALALVAVILATWTVMRARSVSVSEPVATPSWSQPVATPSATVSPPWLVHVLGAVANPGVVSVSQGARVIDAIEAAGGFALDADPQDLNLAAILVDGCQVVIGTVTEPLGQVRQGAGGESEASVGAPASAASTVNLNHATVEQLDTLPGVGPVTANAIVAWRTKNGQFTSVSQLQEVDGIGPKTFAQLQPYVSV